jgi:hypothetical protein
VQYFLKEKLMSIETRETLTVANLALYGVQVHEINQTLLTIDARATPLLNGTVLGKIIATGKWAPWSNVATNGVATSIGIYDGEDIPAATIDAADVVGLNIIVSGEELLINEGLLVCEGSLTLDSIIGTGVTTTTLRELFKNRGINYAKTNTLYTGAY